jgi:hypothetical protein
MKSQRRSLAFISFCAIAALGLAAQSKDSGLAPADGLENWKQGIDLGSYKSGKYNLIVEGKDKAGNVTRAAPMNIYVDPKSDLPIVSIINPTSLMRVGGDLNIVGTAADDDGVAKVEVSLDGGEYLAADGGEFWSLYLKTGQLEEGRRTLDVRAVDVNGLAGPSVRVRFDLDRTKPLAAIGSPQVGSLVSGKISLSGTVFDANGVRSLEISKDGGKTWASVPLKKGKDPQRPSFSWAVDTSKLGDGPKVFNLRSVDMVGSKSTAAYLLFIDNTKPSIEIARPAAGQAVNGRFIVAGAVRDAVGVKRLSYEFGADQKGEIALTKGDPFFVKELDASSIKGDSAPITLVAEDRIGNVTKMTQACKIDRKADKPVLKVLGPAAGPAAPAGGSAADKTAPALVLRAGDRVWGQISDDDGVSAFRWSLDGGAPTEVPCSESFSLDLGAAPTGKHALSLVPVDSNGLAGDPVALPVIIDKGPGSVVFDRITSAKASRDFAQGAETAVDSGEFLEGSIAALNQGLVAEYSIAGGKSLPLALAKAEAKEGSAGPSRFRIALDRSLPYGFASIEVVAKDGTGNEFRGKALLYVADYAIAREEPGFRFSDPRVGSDGLVAFGRAAPDKAAGQEPVIRGAFYGGELSSLRFDPPTDLVTASFDGRVVSIVAAKDGRSAPTRILGTTTKGRVFSAGPFVFLTDSTPPALSIDSPAEGSWFNAKTVVTGKASDRGGPFSLSWRRLPDGASKKLEAKPDGSFSIELSASDLPSGAFSIEVEAKDSEGNQSRAYRSLGADAQPPQATFLSPEKGSSVWGPEDVAALVSDASGLVSVEYSSDGASFSAIASTSIYFAHRADFAANPKACYRLTDKAGNKAVVRPETVRAEAPAREPASASVSVESAPGEARVELAGTAGSVKASLSLPGLSEADFAALGDADSKLPSRFPSRLLVQGAVSLKGQATVPGKAKAVSLSLDGGATYKALAANKDEKSAKEQLPFSLTVEAASLAQGKARWAIKVEDFSGAVFICPVYCLVDSKAPSIAQIYPEAGVLASPGPFPLVLRIEDENGLSFGELSQGAAKDAPKTGFDAASGGRYFATIVDPLSAPKGAPLALSVAAKDGAGNQSALALKFGYDAPADAPKITVDSLVPESGGLVSGSVSDDDGSLGLRASIDGGDAIAFPSGAYAFALGELAVGKHTLSLETEGSPGAAGQAALKKEFAVKGAAPAMGGFAIGDAKASLPWAPGADFELSPASAILGKAVAPNGLVSVSVSINGAAPIQAAIAKAAGQESSFSAPIPATLPYGPVTIELRAKDSSGLETLERLELHKVLAAISGTDDDEGIRFSDSRIAFLDDKSSFLLSVGDKLQGRFNGRPVKSVALSPQSAALSAAFDGQAIVIEAKAEALIPSASLELTTVDGDRFSWGPFSAALDAAPPALEVSSPASDSWVSGRVRVAGKASDPQGIVLLQASVNGGEPLSLAQPEALKAKGEIAFDKVIDLSGIADGSAMVDIIARDGAGRESRVSRFINEDATPPVLAQVLPLPDESVNGLTTFIGEVLDGGRLASVVFLSSPPSQGAADAKAEEVSGLREFSRDLDLARLSFPLPEGCGFVAEDKAGNKTALSPKLAIDKEKDKPVSEIDTPSEMEVLRGNFEISGAAYDDDGLAAAYYRIDSGEWKKLEMDGTSFSIPVALKDTTDNEHLVEVKAEDIYGVQGDVASRKYRISKEEPLAAMLSPSIFKPVRGTVKVSGTASDANGVKETSVSVDNRTSYDKPLGAEAWSINLDTTTLSDGIHAVAVKPVDGYDTEGFYASMISVDNTPPKVQMDLPRDGDEVAGTLFVSGRVSDNILVASARIEVAPVGSSSPPAIVENLGLDRIAQRSINVSGLKEGAYTVRLVANDRADNEALASRDIVVVGSAPRDSVGITFPVEGEVASGKLRIQGRASMASGAQTVSILADGAEIGSAACDELGWYFLDLPVGAIADGDHVLAAKATSAEGRAVQSPGTRVSWKTLGPWVSIESFPSGKYLKYRPFLSGRAGWSSEAAPEGDKQALDAYKKEAATRKVAAIEVSLDDGRTFAAAKGTSSWSFRLETQDFKEGALHVIVRATYADGTTAAAKGLYYLDKTLPEVQVLSPTEGGRFNGKLEVSGRAYDENGIAFVGAALRSGDKANYEVPSFIQGLYLDGQGLGATDWQAGIGLSFFGDNVKLQANYGQAPEYAEDGRRQSFYGDVFGGKLIANVLYIPAESILGPDWSFLSTSIGLGANFTYFTQTQAGSGLIVGSVFGQLEFPKITFREMSVFKKVSLYSEIQLWVLSSVVDGGFIPKVSFGARVGVF